MIFGSSDVVTWSAIGLILLGVIGWLITRLYSSHIAFVKDQFKDIKGSNVATGTKLDGIQTTVTDVQSQISKIDKEKVGWAEFREVKDEIEEDRSKDIELAISRHREKDHGGAE